MKKLVFGFIAVVMFSNLSFGQDLRSRFLANKKSHTEIINAYNELSDEEQRNLWLEKFDQILSLNLPSAHKELVQKLRGKFYNGVAADGSDEFFIDASELAKITPVKDFGYMFETLSDYKYNGKFMDDKYLSEEYINDVKNLNPYVNLNQTYARGNCSCRWCLGHQGYTGNNCKVTEHGCGFLWLQSCNQCLICL